VCESHSFAVRLQARRSTDVGKQEYDAFEWGEPDAEQEIDTALVPMAALPAAQALLLDAQRREQETREPW
jgi:hypothetical protein